MNVFKRLRAATAGLPTAILHMGLLSFLIGCFVGGGPYRKKNGEWYYKDNRMRVAPNETVTPLNDTFAKTASAGFFMGATVSGADGATFQALSDHYAKDGAHVFYCDTYRDGKEYFSIKHLRTITIAGADPASFRTLDERYARDRASMYFEGDAFAVKDFESFQLLEDNFAKDKFTGYYLRKPIAGSDGPTFAAVSGNYSKDATHVFYSGLNLNAGSSDSAVVTRILTGAQPTTFTALESGYASDGSRAYYNDHLLETSATGFRVLQYDYAASATHVYHRGELVKGADAGTFETIPIVDQGPTAKDKNGFFNYATRVKK